MLRITVVCAAAALLAAPQGASAEDAYTTRIEPRAVYGATVTIEEGVRVFRPIPSERHVIINPGGMAPLSLGYYYDPRSLDPRYAPRGYEGYGTPRR